MNYLLNLLKIVILDTFKKGKGLCCFFAVVLFISFYPSYNFASELIPSSNPVLESIDELKAQITSANNLKNELKIEKDKIGKDIIFLEEHISLEENKNQKELALLEEQEKKLGEQKLRLEKLKTTFKQTQKLLKLKAREKNQNLAVLKRKQEELIETKSALAKAEKTLKITEKSLAEKKQRLKGKENYFIEKQKLITQKQAQLKLIDQKLSLTKQKLETKRLVIVTVKNRLRDSYFSEEISPEEDNEKYQTMDLRDNNRLPQLQSKLKELEKKVQELEEMNQKLLQQYYSDSFYPDKYPKEDQQKSLIFKKKTL